MEISKIDSIKNAFLIKSVDLKSLDNLFNQLPGESTYSIETSDGIERKYKTMHEVLSHENSSKNPIQKITLQKSSRDPNLLLIIIFNKDSYNCISYYFSTNEENLIPKINRIMECVESTKAWYSSLSQNNFISFYFSLIALSILTIILLGFFGIIQISSTQIEQRLISFNYGIFIFGIITGMLLYIFKHRIFPIGVFAIGQGEKKYDDLVFFQGASLTILLAIVAIIISIYV